MTTEPAFTPFNLTYAPAPMSLTGNDTPNGNITDSSGIGHPSERIIGILAGLFVPHLVCTVVILARTWSRLFVLRKWFPDDSLIISAWIFSTAVYIVYSYAAATPTIRDALEPSDTDNDASLDSLKPYLLRTYIGLVCYQFCLCLTKLSILSFYLRVFASRPTERRLALATVLAVLAYGIPLLLMSLLQCHPSQGLFFGLPTNTCFAFQPLLIASASLHTAADGWLIALIVPCIVRLDLPPRQKAALAAVLSLSVFVIAASLTRLQLALHAGFRPPGSGTGTETGSSGVHGVSNTLAFYVMTVLELDLAIVCASAPTLRPVIARLWPRWSFGGGGVVGFGQPAQSTRRRYGGGAARGRGREGENEADEEDGSVNLTSVVSYHGYPWPARPIQPRTPTSVSLAQRSKDNIIDYDMTSMPIPPVPALLSHRTPTTLSLRSFISSITPRSRGGTVSGKGTGEDRAGLLRSSHEREGEAEDTDGSAEPRRSSVGFEGYYDQYLGYGEEKPRSRRRDSAFIGVKPIDTQGVTRPGTTEGQGQVRGRWGESQESFVMGLNDPASPSRLSPVSMVPGSGVGTRSPTKAKAKAGADGDGDGDAGGSGGGDGTGSAGGGSGSGSGSGSPSLAASDDCHAL